MGARSRTSFQKRQKELARLEKQREKAARKAARKLAPPENGEESLNADSPEAEDQESPAVDATEAQTGPPDPIDRG